MRTAVLAAVTALALPGGCGGSKPLSLPGLATMDDVAAPVGDGRAVEWLPPRPGSLAEVADRADFAVIATVVSVDRGKPIVAAADEINETRLVRLQVRDGWFGIIPDRFTINWLEGTDGDPPYRLGQDYVLFLMRRPDGPWYRPEAPDGRIQILHERPHPVITGSVADEAAKLGLAGIKREALRAAD